MVPFPIVLMHDREGFSGVEDVATYGDVHNPFVPAGGEPLICRRKRRHLLRWRRLFIPKIPSCNKVRNIV